MTPAPVSLKDRLRVEALRLGFSDFGVCRPDAAANAAPQLRAFLAAGRHGEMTWMAERVAWRESAKTLWPQARSVVMLAENYSPVDDPLALLARKERGAISVYARGRDYHDLVKKRLKALGRWLIEAAGREGEDAEIKVFVDTAPVMEKPLAEAAGLGWRGKHTNLVSRELGSWFFLGALFTTLDLPPDAPHPDRCGGCRRCLDVCPTAAFPAPYQLDARRCVSYLTIELKGPIPRAMRPLIGNRVYGCDDCLAVCPWNKFAAVSAEAGYWARTELAQPRLADLAGLDDAGFRQVFAGSPIKRIGRERFLRNVLTAIGNSGDHTLLPATMDRLDDQSPLIRGAAVWAVGRLDPAAFEAARAAREQTETDETVRAEWRLSGGRTPSN